MQINVIQKYAGWVLLAGLAAAALVWAFRPRPLSVDAGTVSVAAVALTANIHDGSHLIHATSAEYSAGPP